MYFLQLLQQSPVDALVFLFAIVLAVTVHEFAHAWAADRLGDDTPRLQGRVSLNPADHLDPMGSILFLLVGFGWGKPVIYNPMRLSRRVDELLVALAGPASNLLFALVAHLLLAVMVQVIPGLEVYGSPLSTLARINVALAAFNMLPVPPLDGSAIVAYFWPEYRSIAGGQIGLILLLVLLFLPVAGGQSLINFVLPPIMGLFHFLTTLFGILP
jgi:Zn-dependent protease